MYVYKNHVTRIRTERERDKVESTNEPKIQKKHSERWRYQTESKA